MAKSRTMRQVLTTTIVISGVMPLIAAQTTRPGVSQHVTVREGTSTAIALSPEPAAAPASRDR
jgi:hypothetical protein